jgi:hypothetical protein
VRPDKSSELTVRLLCNSPDLAFCWQRPTRTCIGTQSLGNEERNADAASFHGTAIVEATWVLKFQHGVLRSTPFAGALIRPAASGGDRFRGRQGRSAIGGSGKHRGGRRFIERQRALKAGEELAHAFERLAGAESAVGHDAQEQVGQSLFAGWGIHQLHMLQRGRHPDRAALLALACV